MTEDETVGCITDSKDVNLSKLQEILCNGASIKNVNNGVQRAFRLVNTLRCWDSGALRWDVETLFFPIPFSMDFFHLTVPKLYIL